VTSQKRHAEIEIQCTSTKKARVGPLVELRKVFIDLLATTIHKGQDELSDMVGSIDDYGDLGSDSETLKMLDEIIAGIEQLKGHVKALEIQSQALAETFY
jgi:hypothetical protein